MLEPRAARKPFVAPDPFQPSVAQRRFDILVVDDQPDMLALIGIALEEDYAVRTAPSGPDALRMIGELMPDLVVLDYRMAGMDGLSVVKALRANPTTRELPVLMLTGNTDEPTTRAGFEAGVTDYVTKPFSIPALCSRVRACLARAHPL